MPDISMCQNTECPIRSRCYRYRAKPKELWQGYARFTFREDGTCEYQMEIDGWHVLPTEEIDRYLMEHARRAEGQQRHG